MNKVVRYFFLLLTVIPLAVSCSDDDDVQAEPDGITAVTDENYALAETQVIFTDYVSRIAKATGTSGTGIFSHARNAPDPTDRTVLRINFDTRYSFAILDLAQPATLVMPETNGRYMSAWFITEEHYNPMAITSPGIYTITQDAMGSRYVMVVLRTQVNMRTLMVRGSSLNLWKQQSKLETITDYEKRTFYLTDYSLHSCPLSFRSSRDKFPTF